jgi:hypothetical protein
VKHGADYDVLMDAIRQADGLVVASPVYVGGYTALLRTFFEHTACWWHRPDPDVVGTPVLAIVTTAGSFAKRVAAQLEEMVNFWGAFSVGCLTFDSRTLAAVSAMPTPEAQLAKLLPDKAVALFLSHLVRDRASYRPTAKHLSCFQTFALAQMFMVSVNKGGNLENVDADHWIHHGWVKADGSGPTGPYFFACRPHLGSRLRVGAQFALARFVVRKFVLPKMKPTAGALTTSFRRAPAIPIEETSARGVLSAFVKAGGVSAASEPYQATGAVHGDLEDLR